MQEVQSEINLKRSLRNTLVAHTNGDLSYRLDGHWTIRVPNLSQAAYLALLRRSGGRGSLQPQPCLQEAA